MDGTWPSVVWSWLAFDHAKVILLVTRCFFLHSDWTEVTGDENVAL